MIAQPLGAPAFGPLLGASFDRALTIVVSRWKLFLAVAIVTIALGAANIMLSWVTIAAFLTYWYFTSLANTVRLENPAYRMDASVVLRLIGQGLLIGIAIDIGFLLLIVPGIYIANKWSLAPLILVKENCSIGESLQRSWTATDPFWWPTFGFNILAGLAVVAVAFVGIFIADAILFAVIATSDTFKGAGPPPDFAFGGPAAMAIAAAYLIYAIAVAYTYQAKDNALLNWYNGIRNAVGTPTTTAAL